MSYAQERKGRLQLEKRKNPTNRSEAESTTPKYSDCQWMVLRAKTSNLFPRANKIARRPETAGRYPKELNESRSDTPRHIAGS